MKKPTPPPDLWSQMDRVREEFVEKEISLAHPGSEWFSVYEYMDRYKKNVGVARRELQRLVDSGYLETDLFRARRRRNGVHSVTQLTRFYRLRREERCQSTPKQKTENGSR